MNRFFIILAALLPTTAIATSVQAREAQKVQKPQQTIFAFGGDFNQQKFIQYVTDLTGKENPVVLFVPTASADNAETVEVWEYFCGEVGIEPHVLRVWVSSDPEAKSFEDQILSADAIVVGGGNTLNMMGIWRAQGIDRVMREALERGIILAGGSAGSICWFENGVSDARPTRLSVIDGLGFLPFSHCPHYGQPERKELYRNLLRDRNIKAGYAMDDKAGILFRDGRPVEAVSTTDAAGACFVSRRNGEVVEERLPARILLNPGALTEEEYTVLDTHPAAPEALRVFAMGDDFIGAVLQYPGYTALRYLYKENGEWANAGEDPGGDTLLEDEITFREKAKMIAAKVVNE